MNSAHENGAGAGGTQAGGPKAGAARAGGARAASGGKGAGWAGAGPPDRRPPDRRPPDPGPPDLRTPEGFGAFYEEHIDAVLGFVTRRVADPHLAADLTADIFLAALKDVAGYRPDRGVPIAWLYGIARNVLANHAREGARERGAMQRLSGRRLLDDQDVAALEERIDAQRAFRDLAERHAALSEPLRAALDLVVIDGLTPAEAAQALGVTQATIRVRLHRARRALRTPADPAASAAAQHLEVAR